MAVSIQLIVNIYVVTTLSIIYLFFLIYKVITKRRMLSLLGCLWISAYICSSIMQLFIDDTVVILFVWFAHQFLWTILLLKTLYLPRNLIMGSGLLFILTGALGTLLAVFLDNQQDLNVTLLLVVYTFITIPSVIVYINLILRLRNQKSYFHKVLPFIGFNLFSNISIFFFIFSIIQGNPIFEYIATRSYVIVACFLIYQFSSSYLLERK